MDEVRADELLDIEWLFLDRVASFDILVLKYKSLNNYITDLQTHSIHS